MSAGADSPLGPERFKPGDAGLLVLLLGLPLLSAFQGLDFTDTGWVATNYQLIFADPESIRYWFHIWLSNVIGGLVYDAVAPVGLLGLKLAAAVVFWASCLVVWRALKPVVPARAVLLGLLLAYGFQFPRVPVVHYNNLTALFHFASVLCLLEGLRRERPWLLAAAGGVEAANVFVRLPNAAGIALASVIVYHALVAPAGSAHRPPSVWGRALPQRRADVFVRLGWFAGGYVLGLLAVVVAMAAVGHLRLYIVSVEGLFESTGSDLSGYDLKTIAGRFLRQNGQAVVYGLAVMVPLAGAGLFLSRWRRTGPAVFALVAAALFVAAARLDGARTLMRAALGLAYVPLALALLMRGEAHRNLKVACFAAIIVLALLSIGSDTGAVVSLFGYALAFPLVLAACFAAAADPAVGSRLPALRAAAPLIPAFFVVFAALGSAYLLARYTYRDSADRRAMTATVRNPMLRGVYTTAARAQVAGEMLDELSRRVRPGDPLLALESIPMVNFATRTRPYLGNSWPNLYVGNELERSLEWALKARAQLPVVVEAKTDTRDRSWPQNTSLNQGDVSVLNRERIQRFLDRFAYRVVWENVMFRILEPWRKAASE